MFFRNGQQEMLSYSKKNGEHCLTTGPGQVHITTGQTRRHGQLIDPFSTKIACHVAGLLSCVIHNFLCHTIHCILRYSSQRVIRVINLRKVSMAMLSSLFLEKLLKLNKPEETSMPAQLPEASSTAWTSTQS